jgi:hypothetical protein
MSDTKNGIDWKQLAIEASRKREELWSTVIKAMEILEEDIPDVEPEIREAYVGLRIGYYKARTLLYTGQRPGPGDLDPAPEDEAGPHSSFKNQVLDFMALVEAGCIEAGGSPDDIDLAQRVATEIMRSGRSSDPLT